MTTNAAENGENGRGVRFISWRQLIIWGCVALASFHAAHSLSLGWLLLPCAYGLIELSHAPTNRKVFYPMLGVGFLLYAPQLGFFWNIFNGAALPLWLVPALWVALFGLTLRHVRLRFGTGWTLALAPFIWTGIEYFRSELYYLRFSWLAFGMANLNSIFHGLLGMYAFGFAVFVIAAILQSVRLAQPDLANFNRLNNTVNEQLPLGGPVQLMTLLLLGLLFLELLLPANGHRVPAGPKVAGVQLEFPSENEVIHGLERARHRFPDTELFMLSEYTFLEPIPQSVRDWCVSHRTYLVVGGKEPLGDTNYYNTAFVIGPDGNTVHQQVKSVPIQFFQDGLPAPQRTVWDSPWGRLGVLTCYDLSYTRVVDDFVRQGVVGLLNPTMDVQEWGAHQHTLHSHVAPVRAAEYRLPIFRVASSGISQLTDARGNILASAPFPGEGAIIGGTFPLLKQPRTQVPFMHGLAPFCSGLAGLALVAGLIPSRKTRRRPPESAP